MEVRLLTNERMLLYKAILFQPFMYGLAAMGLVFAALPTPAWMRIVGLVMLVGFPLICGWDRRLAFNRLEQHLLDQHRFLGIAYRTIRYPLDAIERVEYHRAAPGEPQKVALRLKEDSQSEGRELLLYSGPVVLHAYELSHTVEAFLGHDGEHG